MALDARSVDEQTTRAAIRTHHRPAVRERTYHAESGVLAARVVVFADVCLRRSAFEVGEAVGSRQRTSEWEDEPDQNSGPK